jgi:hypothetical protein
LSDMPLPPSGFSPLAGLDDYPKVAAALGEMVVAWSRAERALVAIVMTVSGLSWEMANAALVSLPTYDARSKMICGMLKQWKTETHSPSAMLFEMKKLDALAETRERWLHSLWVQQHGKEKRIFAIDNRRGIANSERAKAVKAQDIRNHIEALNGRAEKLYALCSPSL